MTTSTPAAILIFRDLDRESWATTPYASIVAQCDGQMLEHIPAPGLVVGFPKASAATRAALRCHHLFEGTYEGEEKPPPMMIDAGAEVKRAAVATTQIEPGMILLSKDAADLMAGEPLQLLPGPVVDLDGGTSFPTRILPSNPYHIGWALPTVHLDAQKRAGLTDPPVIHIEMRTPWHRFLPSLPVPWRLFTMILVASVALLTAYRLSVRFLPRPDTPQFSYSRFIPDDPSESAMSGKTSFDDPIPEIGYLPLGPNIPAGFGTVEIRTDPADAKVFLDGELIGEASPLELERKSNRFGYRLTVRKEGFDPVTSIFNVQAGKRKIIKISLARRESDQGPPQKPSRHRPARGLK